MPLIKSINLPPKLQAFSMADIEEAARRKLLRAGQQAEQLLAEAQTQADVLREQARAEGLIEGRTEGFSAGMKEGSESGHAQALNEHRDSFARTIQSLSVLMAELDASRRKLQAEAIGDVVGLAAAIARKVTKRHCQLDPEILGANLNEAMKMVVHASDIRLAVHPLQKTVIDAELPRLQLAWPNLEHVELIEDPTLTPGGCRVFTVDGHIDADIDGQLDRIIDELMPATPK